MDTRKGGRSGKVIKARKYRKTNLLYNPTSQYSLAAFICVLMFPYLTNHFVLTSFPYVWSSLCNPKCLFVVVNVIVIFLVGESRAGASTRASTVNEIYEEYVKRSRRMRRSSSVQGIRKPPAEEEKSPEAGAGRPVVEVKELVRGGGEEEMDKKAVDENEEENKGEEKRKEEEEEEGKEKVVDEAEEENKHKERQKEEEEEERREKVEDENEEEKKSKEEEEEEGGLMPREELNRRVEAFIARVNKQRRIESRLVVCCKA